MKLSARSRYATRILLDLAEHTEDRPLCASAISEKTDISVPFIEQILRPLKKAGYIKSVRGAYGGHIFLKDPACITLGDIVRTMEGDIKISQCSSNPNICERSGDCRTRIAWERISQTMERELDAITLADLMFNPDKIGETSVPATPRSPGCAEEPLTG
ncbi:RrF2 family transcriptional regulator [Desulfonatronum thioautotrophicum]|uniref:RrF2 family transcriptional regulator n=1 Tax=Desulfonatronum thioautotrophicum TaxID=617001 RepID=UPI000A043690|nr:Rrf2 family transcriptional regulator [Desulfonatronum thioautotrophicum]